MTNDDDNHHGYEIDTCTMCGESFEPSGWWGLCSRSCFYDLTELFMNYEHDHTGEVELDLRVIGYLLRYPEENHAPPESSTPRVYARLQAYLPKVCGDAEEYAVDEPILCTMCGDTADGSGWKDLCCCGCYYDLRELLYAYESGTVTVPDERVVSYFSANPDGGGHWFEPRRIFTYIDSLWEQSRTSAAGGAGEAAPVGEYTAKWNALAARAPAKAHSSPRKLNKWVKRKMAKERLKAEKKAST